MSNKYSSIAIDGPAGSGKSTIAKLVALKLNYKYINTGLMYRSMAYFTHKYNWNIINSEEIIQKYLKLNIHFISDEEILFNNKNIIDHLRSEKVSLLAAKIAKNKEIRFFFVNQQRKMSGNSNVVMDGRDIGSVVLPNSKLKIYMWASPEIRATRRVKQNLDIGISEDYDDVLKQIIKRDYNDINRKNSPLIQTKDAIKLDTSHMSLNEVVEKVISLI